MRKWFLLLIIVVVSVLVLPVSALAVDYSVGNDQTLNLSTGELILTSNGTTITTYPLASGDRIIISSNSEVTLTGTSPSNLRVVCQSTAGAGDVELTLEGVTIDNSTFSGMSAMMPITFNGVGNNLVISDVAGPSTLKAGGIYSAGILVNSGTSLTIRAMSDTATLNTYGRFSGTGIGSVDNFNGGDITILGGIINAYGGFAAAGIGAATDGDAGTITIKGGTVNAIGGQGGAGIGNSLETGGFGSIINITGGTVYAEGTSSSSSNIGGSGIGGGPNTAVEEINISGGTVTAVGGGGSAGIGNGYGATVTGGTINISGGTVSATGGENAAGIGGGQGGTCGNITLSNELVYAAAGSGATYDIGTGNSGSGGSLEISGTVAVFLENNSVIAPSLPVPHDHKTPSDATDPLIFDSNTVYGLTVDASWTGVDGGYFILNHLTYDVNGGTGTVPTAGAQHISTNVIVEDDSTISYDGYDFDGWNTLADGSGTTYSAGDTLTLPSDMALYARWTPKLGAVTLTKTDGTNAITTDTADFTLYDSSDNAIIVTGTVGSYTYSSTGSSADTPTTMTTDTNGQIIINDLPYGDYYFIETKAPDGYLLDGISKHSFTLNNSTAAINVSNNKQYSIGNYVWIDSDGDGIRSAGDNYINDVVVTLYTGAGTQVGTSVTTGSGTWANGYYEFNNLLAGDYYLVFTLPTGYSFTTQNSGTDDTIDSDAHPTTGETAVITLNDSSTDSDSRYTLLSAGIYQIVDDTDRKSVEIENPKTGDDGFDGNWMWIIGLGLLSTYGAYVLMKKLGIIAQNSK